MQISIELTELERLILETDMANPEAYFENMVVSKIATMKDKILETIVRRRIAAQEPIENDLDLMIQQEHENGHLKTATQKAEELNVSAPQA